MFRSLIIGIKKFLMTEVTINLQQKQTHTTNRIPIHVIETVNNLMLI